MIPPQVLVLQNGGRRMTCANENQDVLNSTILVDDQELAIPLDMDHRYCFRAIIPFRLLGSLSGFSFALSVPGEGQGSTISAVLKVFSGPADNLLNAKVDQNAPVTINGIATPAGRYSLEIDGLIRVATGFTGGLSLKFAQNVADPVNAFRRLPDAMLMIDDYG